MGLRHVGQIGGFVAFMAQGTGHFRSLLYSPEGSL
jgi:hypothetical protein